ncbi:LAME_0G02388g1_1 [Lachancea meyersii CBS 8951]|uniref:LAME_0G02388g1_1 n=1 Tax=Lachancea meyersii CBS 8951 TaxID=1266667 RepID=A0A1G4K608_9SACH|nr:LAME_0G02388g1_1 [Lachancea meyersii CBS 8951]
MKGFFSKKNHESKKEALKSLQIECTTVIREPPSRSVRQLPSEPLNSQKLDCYSQVVAHFESPDLLILTKSEKSGRGDTSLEPNKQPLSLKEKQWLTKDRILRYLRSTQWDPKRAIKRVESTIVWRREFGLFEDDSGTSSTLLKKAMAENETGKMYLLGYDRHRRPLLHIKPGRQNTSSSFAQIQHLMYMIECAEALMPPGVESLTLLIDFRNYNGLAPPLARMPPVSISKQVLHIVQEHYPEYLGRAILCNIPWYCWNFLKIFHPFLDPATRPKLVYEEYFDNYIEQSQLEVMHNGNLDFFYDNKPYLEDLANCVTERRSHMFQNFVNLGSRVGLDEHILKSYESKVDKC